MTLEQLRIFIMVAETLNMRVAAERLYLTQPAVSAAIAALENRYGIKLFDRVGRALELNEMGRRFLPEAQAILDKVKEACGLFENLSGLVQGTFCIAASQTVATYYLPSHLARFASAHPGLTLEILVGNTVQAISYVLAGDADMGVIEGQTEEQSLEIQPIRGDSFGFYVAPTHFLAGCIPTRDDLLKACWVSREVGSGTRDYVVSTLKKRFFLDFDELKIRLELLSNDAVLEAVMEGEFMAAETDLAAKLRLHNGLIQRLDYTLRERNFYIIRHRERCPFPAVREFCSLLLAENKRCV